MQLYAYLHFDGTCEEAFKFYETALGGEIIVLMTHEGMPMDVPPAWQKKVMHARIKIGDSVLMGADSPPGRHEKPAGFSVSINVTDAAQADQAFAALAAGGEIKMPIQETFWAVRFGMVTDRFGTPWMINCEKNPDGGLD